MEGAYLRWRCREEVRKVTGKPARAAAAAAGRTECSLNVNGRTKNRIAFLGMIAFEFDMNVSQVSLTLFNNYKAILCRHGVCQ